MKPALLLALLALLAGCGGGSNQAGSTATQPAAATAPTGAPRPAESAELAVTRLAKAARADDCRRPADLFPSENEVGIPLCRHVLEGLDLKLPPDVKTYGSGAVAKNGNGGSTVLALDGDGRFKFVISFDSPDLPTAPVKNADESMSRVIGAIRRDSCEDLLPFSLARDEKFCAARPIRHLHAALDRAYTASPTALGGDGRYAFYGLRVKPHYFTLVFLASKNGQYFFVTSTRA